MKIKFGTLKRLIKEANMSPRFEHAQLLTRDEVARLVPVAAQEAPEWFRKFWVFDIEVTTGDEISITTDDGKNWSLWGSDSDLLGTDSDYTEEQLEADDHQPWTWLPSRGEWVPAG